MGNPYRQGLEACAANQVPLSPLSFLMRAARVFPDKPAIVHGARRITYAEMLERCRRFASALGRLGVGPGDTVAVLAANTPAMLEAHYAVPMAGAVLNALNFRLDAPSIARILEHGQARVFIVDREFAATARKALAEVKHRIRVVGLDDELCAEGKVIGEIEYEAFLAGGDPDYPCRLPDDERAPIALNYTSGTTGNPKGAVYTHRGAYLNALGDALSFGLSGACVYLWTLPMFHCNGWCFTWSVTAVGGTHVCLRKVDPGPIFKLIVEHSVTHCCGAPIVLNMLVHAPESVKLAFDRPVEVATGGAAPPSAVIAAMERMGFRVTHLYGLTETYGPATICEPQAGWEGLEPGARAGRMARQGVAHPTVGEVEVRDPATLDPVPWDGATIGEVMVRSNTVMAGYLGNPSATEDAFRGGWFHSGDLAVMHPDGYMEVKDRSKDIIISGGENISSLEVEEVLYRHPCVMEAAVVAKPDARWGETPCAFVHLKPGAPAVEAAEIISWCRDHMAHFKVPHAVVFGELPKTSTGKIQKFVLRERAKQA